MRSYNIHIMYIYLILEIIAWMAGVIAVMVFLEHILKTKHVKIFFKRKWVYIPLIVLVLSIAGAKLSSQTYAPSFAMPPFMHSMAPGNVPPTLPLVNIIKFFMDGDEFEHVADIGQDPNNVPAPINRKESAEIKMHITTKEVLSEVAKGIYFNYWTFDGKVPGPMLRVRDGDTILLSLTNDKTSLHSHNIDLHAVSGPGGGAVLLNVKPGETKTLKWKAINPGLYIYHCATANVSTHNSHGQYGLILVEPKEGMSPVDKEFYVVQGELYTQGETGKKGLMVFDSNALIAGHANYVTFNGKIETAPRMHAKVGDKIRIYVGNGGVNLISSFHVIGAIFDKVNPEGSMGEGSATFKNVQTTLVPPGGATIVEFTVQEPGKYLLVDHALSRMNLGAWAQLDVTGDARPDIYSQIPNPTVLDNSVVSSPVVENEEKDKKMMGM